MRNTHRRQAERKIARQLLLESLDPRQLMAADVAFDGSAVLYQTHGNGANSQLSSIKVETGEFNDIGDTIDSKLNATGYRVTDHFIYGMRVSSRELVKIDAEGDMEVLGEVEGLPNRNFYSADFGPDGLLYIWTAKEMYGVNVDTQSVDRVVTLSRKTGSTPDIAYNPVTGLMYGVERNGRTSNFISINHESGEVTTINDQFTPSGTYGAVFADASGRVFTANNKGGLYEVELETGEPTYVGHTPRASSNDGASPSSAVMNLPPVAHTDWASMDLAVAGNSLNLTSPSDPEGQAITIEVTGLPNIGEITRGDGGSVSVGDRLTLDELNALLYDSPISYNDEDVGALTYDVSDGVSTASGRLDIEIGGFSKLGGYVEVLHDDDNGSYEGYAFNNEIQLSGTALDGTPVEASTTTDAFGNFEFVDLAPGTYTLTQVQPDVVKEAYAAAGVLGGTASENVIADIVIPAGEAGSYVDNVMYEYAPVAVSGFVYVDDDIDGEIDSREEIIGNVQVNLSGTNDLGEAVALSATTDVFGLYEFTGLRPGDYVLTQSQPDGYTGTSTQVGTWGGISGSDSITLTLGAGAEANQYNFGEYLPSSLSGFVFRDNDWDNVRDEGDTPIETITITLEGTDNDGNAVSVETTTDSDGAYRFDNLTPGTYTITQPNQPEGLIDGRLNVGRFEGEKDVIAANGVAGDDVFSSIQITHGDQGAGYNFGERIFYELVQEFDASRIFEGTTGDDVFEFIAGSDFHTVRVNGEETLLDASLRHNIQFIGLAGEDRITMTGTEDVDTVKMRPFQTDYHTRNYRVRSFQTEHSEVNHGGGLDRVYLYDSEGDDFYRATEDYVKMWSDGYSNRANGFHRTAAQATKGGFDEAKMTDSKRDDSFKGSHSNARLFSRYFYNYTRGFEKVTAASINGGYDNGYLWDSPEDGDVFQSKEAYARIYNSEYYVFTSGFDQVKAYANQGGENDRAYFYDTAGDDILVSSPLETGLVTEDYAHSVHKFERMYAWSESGDDRAFLYDSKLDDILQMRPEDTRLYNDDYYLKAIGFGQVDAYSSGGGNDRAYFFDSVGDDTLVAVESEVRMYGTLFDNTAHGFARNYGFSNAGGNDTAILWDSDQADTLKVGSQSTKMYGQTYYNRMEGFAKVETVFSDLSNQDRALIFGGIASDTVDDAGVLSGYISDNSSGYIYGADVVASMLEEETENDIFAIPADDGDVYEFDVKSF